jgi:hypothetical protein
MRGEGVRMNAHSLIVKAAFPVDAGRRGKFLPR